MSRTTSTLSSPRGEITLFTLTNACGAQVVLSTLGAGVVAIRVPDADGNLADVLTGYQNVIDYICDGPCMGKTPGRYANRIAHGRFALDGNKYELACNCGPHHLHGGPEGFQNKIWEIDFLSDDVVRFALESPDGDEGYPGHVRVEIRYRWSDDCALHINYKARTDAPTVINLTNHPYFNLDGHNAGFALHHKLRIAASRWLETDESLAPTGAMPSVAGTPMDFTTMHEIARDFNAEFPALRHGKGYDHCFVLDEPSIAQASVELVAPTSKRRLEIFTDQPGVQLYTGNWLTGSPMGKDNTAYTDYCAVALECQGLPDAPNHPNFPSQVLRPGETYQRSIIYRFSTTD